jgi:hypothetical protein
MVHKVYAGVSTSQLIACLRVLQVAGLQYGIAHVFQYIAQNTKEQRENSAIKLLTTKAEHHNQSCMLHLHTRSLVST